MREATALHLHVPVPGAVVEVGSEPDPELFVHHVPELTSLLHMALLSSTEMTLPTVLELTLDIAHSLIAADAQLLRFTPTFEPGSHVLLARGMDPARAPLDPDVLHAWVGYAGKPVAVEHGQEADMDAYLSQLRMQAALAVPLFLQHGWAGSLQFFRSSEGGFTLTEARLAWLLTLLAENQMAAIASLQQLARAASTDYLTGLRARGYFDHMLEQEVHRSVRRASPCSLLLVDLDDFKLINDRFGHPAGDEILRQFAAILPRGLREVDTVARFGGDEFAFLLPDTNEEGLRLVAHRVRSAVENHDFVLPGRTLRLRLSIGHAICPLDAHTPEALLRVADAALYQAKQQRGEQRWPALRRAS